MITSQSHSNPKCIPLRSRIVQKSSDKHGFTLVELLVVTTILGILAMMSTAGFAKFRHQAKASRCMSEIRGLEKDISAWAVDKGSYPPDLNTIGQAGSKDPWGNDYVYRPFVTTMMRYDNGVNELNTDFDLYSIGDDHLTDLDIDHDNSQDDIVRGRDGGFVGFPAKY